MKAKTWGSEIWDEKSRHHDDVGVILGTGFRSKDLEKNTRATMAAVEALGFNNLRAGASVLDVGVGPSARFSIALAQRGFRVTGLDASKEALRRAAGNCEKAGVSIGFLESDLTAFTTAEKFEALFCVETFFHLPAHLSLTAFTAFNKALKPQGKALVQFAVLNEMTPGFLLKALVYMTGYKILRPVFEMLGKRTFYVTVARHSEQEIHDIAERTGFRLLCHHNGYFLFEKTRDL
ncbi:MAG: methyltransferase domain-containing protein [Bdellovibrionaceae bacterium]|nr:methyltransferase domain-containing protein [Pseudobdellovibrionaceae bacterium]